MPYTLVETLRQIDPYVQLNDGQTVATVAYRLRSIDPRDLTEYSLAVDAAGRLLIYRLNLRGFLIRPPVFVEQKSVPPIRFPRPRANPADFGFPTVGAA